MKLQQKTIGLLLLVLLSGLLFVATLVWLIVSDRLPIGFPRPTREYRFSLLEEEAVILESYDIKPGGKLIYVKKADGEWKVAQTINNLESILGDNLLSKIVHNKDWLCIHTYRPIHERRPDRQQLFLFQQIDGQWQYVDSIENPTGWSIYDIELLSDNRLLYSRRGISPENNEKDTMEIHCYDLNISPPELMQVIKREHKDGDCLFGMDFHVVGDMLYIYDGDGYFSPEEIKRYNLTTEDYGIFVVIDGKRGRVYDFNSVLAYRYTGTCKFSMIM